MMKLSLICVYSVKLGLLLVIPHIINHEQILEATLTYNKN